MENTYTQITIQAVFAVNGRDNFIQPLWRDELHRYIAGIINSEAKSLAVGGWEDHVHILFGLPPNVIISKLLQKVKGNSSRWLNEKKFITSRFNWQEGYTALSISKNQRDKIIREIMTQEQVHPSISFKEEYLRLLQEYNVQFEEKYLFEFYV